MSYAVSDIIVLKELNDNTDCTFSEICHAALTILKTSDGCDKK